MIARLAMLIWLIFPGAALALPLLADISSHRVEIHSSFTGTQLIVFGARNDPGDVVVTVRGPESDVVVRKKERVAGIWINREEETIANMPLFYRIASSRPLDDVRQYLMFDALSVRYPYEISDAEPQNFSQALLKLMSQQRLYSTELLPVEFMGPTLFKVAFDFPDNMPRGTYTAEAYLFTDGQLSGMHAIPVEVYKIGSDAFLYEAAHEYSIVYGVMAVLLALSIGGSASWLFNRIG